MVMIEDGEEEADGEGGGNGKRALLYECRLRRHELEAQPKASRQGSETCQHRCRGLTTKSPASALRSGDNICEVADYYL